MRDFKHVFAFTFFIFILYNKLMLQIAKKTNTKKIIQTYHLQAKKKFGQNFLVDENIVRKIVKIAGLTKESVAIEIGPGIGSLTEGLAQAAKHVYAYEIDERLAPVLSETLQAYDNIDIIFQDFLKVDPERLKAYQETCDDLCLVANLPYYITTQLITKLIKQDCGISRLVVMVQKEVAEKLCGQEKSPLAFMIDYVGDVSYEMTISKNVFLPSPHVDSAVIKITKTRPIPEDLVTLIETSFTQKRKTLNNNLKSLYGAHTADLLEACGIAPTKRAQQLTIADYVRLLEEGKQYED